MTQLEDIKQTIDCSATMQTVWEAVSTAEGIASWFMPNDFKAVEGHQFHLQSPFGPSPCKVMEVKAPNQITFSWDTDGWIVSFILKEKGEHTEFTLVHGGWKDSETILPKANQKAAVVRENMAGGWVGILGKLKQTVESK